MIENSLNPDYFKKYNANTKIVYLHASPQVLAQRICEKNKKPTKVQLKETLDRILKLYDKRNPLCRLHADEIINTDDKEANEIVTMLVSKKN